MHLVANTVLRVSDPVCLSFAEGPPVLAGISWLVVLIADGGRGGYLKRRVTGVSGVTVISKLLILFGKNKVTPFCIAQSVRCNDSELCNVLSPSLPILRRTVPKVPKNAVRLGLLSAVSVHSQTATIGQKQPFTSVKY